MLLVRLADKNMDCNDLKRSYLRLVQSATDMNEPVISDTDKISIDVVALHVSDQPSNSSAGSCRVTDVVTITVTKCFHNHGESDGEPSRSCNFTAYQATKQRVISNTVRL